TSHGRSRARDLTVHAYTHRDNQPAPSRSNSFAKPQTYTRTRSSHRAAPTSANIFANAATSRGEMPDSTAAARHATVHTARLPAARGFPTLRDGHKLPLNSRDVNASDDTLALGTPSPHHRSAGSGRSLTA